MYIELNDKLGSILNLNHVASIKFDDRMKRLVVVYTDTQKTEEHFMYISAESLLNDKHRIKTKIGL